MLWDFCLYIPCNFGLNVFLQLFKPHVHARVTSLPVCPELTRDVLPRTRDVGSFLSVSATVIRTSQVKVLEYEKQFMCNQCKHVFNVQVKRPSNIIAFIDVTGRGEMVLPVPQYRHHFDETP